MDGMKIQFETQFQKDLPTRTSVVFGKRAVDERMRVEEMHVLKPSGHDAMPRMTQVECMTQFVHHRSKVSTKTGAPCSTENLQIWIQISG